MDPNQINTAIQVLSQLATKHQIPGLYEGPWQQVRGTESRYRQNAEGYSLVTPDPEIFKQHQLPLARIKKIMKSDEDVKMISAEAPVLFAKACEMFIMELTHRAWFYTEENKRRTLQKCDIIKCIQHTDIFDFLLDLVPKKDDKRYEPSQFTYMQQPSQPVWVIVDPAHNELPSAIYTSSNSWKWEYT